jgi:hypothetical protein
MRYTTCIKLARPRPALSQAIPYPLPSPRPHCPESNSSVSGIPVRARAGTRDSALGYRIPDAPSCAGLTGNRIVTRGGVWAVDGQKDIALSETPMPSDSTAEWKTWEHAPRIEAAFRLLFYRDIAPKVSTPAEAHHRTHLLHSVLLLISPRYSLDACAPIVDLSICPASRDLEGGGGGGEERFEFE